MVYQTLHLG